MLNLCHFFESNFGQSHRVVQMRLGRTYWTECRQRGSRGRCSLEAIFPSKRFLGHMQDMCHQLDLSQGLAIPTTSATFGPTPHTKNRTTSDKVERHLRGFEPRNLPLFLTAVTGEVPLTAVVPGSNPDWINFMWG